MKVYPIFDVDNLLKEVEEWLVLVTAKEGIQEMNNAKKPSFAMATEIQNNPKYHSILLYLRGMMEAQASINLTMIAAGGDKGRELIERGIAFVPLFMELISLGYSLALREHSLSGKETVTH